MTKENIKMANIICNHGIRIGLGAGCGLFVRNVAKLLVKDASSMKKVGIWSTALCASWALGHAVDCWSDKAYKLVDEIIDRVFVIKDAEIGFEEE